MVGVSASEELTDGVTRGETQSIQTFFSEHAPLLPPPPLLSLTARGRRKSAVKARGEAQFIRRYCMSESEREGVTGRGGGTTQIIG